jgi:asparagine synthetase B (glutamine-hydrolysing)
MAEHGFERAEPEMTVDSEAIFALAEAHEGRPQALEHLRGSMATAWLDERRPSTLFLARGVGRPLWLGETRDETLFASTKAALEVAEKFLGLKLRKREVSEGMLAVVGNGKVLDKLRFEPDRDFEERSLPAVRAPHEGAFCLQRLAALAAIS